MSGTDAAGGLQAVLQQARAERDREQATLQRLVAQSRQHAAQRAQLHDYRRDYDQRWTQRLAAGGSGREILHAFGSFGTRLSEALSEVDTRAARADDQAQRARQRLVQAELRVAAVERLLERRRAVALRAEVRAEQRQADETAAVRWRSRPRHDESPF